MGRGIRANGGIVCSKAFGFLRVALFLVGNECRPCKYTATDGPLWAKNSIICLFKTQRTLAPIPVSSNEFTGTGCLGDLSHLQTFPFGLPFLSSLTQSLAYYLRLQ